MAADGVIGKCALRGACKAKPNTRACPQAQQTAATVLLGGTRTDVYRKRRVSVDTIDI